MTDTTAMAQLPNLPGYSVRMAPGNRTFPKHQTLHYLVGYQHEAGKEPVLCAEEPRAPETLIKASRPPAPVATATTGARATSKLPKWVEQDRKVLRFFGYFQEHVTDTPNENSRIRRVVFMYYLADDTLQVSEPKQDNSGLPQGNIIKRHKASVRREGAAADVPATSADFAVGATITLYGTTYYLVDADAFTRNWYRETLGMELPPALPYPTQPLDVFRASRARTKATLGPPSCRTDDLTRFNEARLGKPSHVLEHDSLAQFLTNDGKVLRFWAVWDDRTNLYGDRRPYVVHYYLADDTMEVLEVHEMNSGRDPFPIFIGRGPMPKPGNSPTGFSVTKRVKKAACYCPEDLRIGTAVELHGRTMVLYACDTFTRRWYRHNLGYTDEELADLSIQEEVPRLPKPAMAPYNGYGTLKDSEQNCRSLVPKPPKKDLRKLINKDGMILRFVCTFQPRKDIGFEVQYTDVGRQFIVQYFMADDTISVFEPPVRNSGILGGKFLERGIKYKYGTEEPYTYKDLYVGAQVVINRFNFALENADEYTISYMENNKHLFIMGDGQAVLKLLKAQVAGKEEALRTAFIELDKDGSGHLDVEELAACLLGCGFRITKHQVLALARLLDTNRSGAVDVQEFLNALGVTSA